MGIHDNRINHWMLWIWLIGSWNGNLRHGDWIWVNNLQGNRSRGLIHISVSSALQWALWLARKMMRWGKLKLRIYCSERRKPVQTSIQMAITPYQRSKLIFHLAPQTSAWWKTHAAPQQLGYQSCKIHPPVYQPVTLSVDQSTSGTSPPEWAPLIHFQMSLNCLAQGRTLSKHRTLISILKSPCSLLMGRIPQRIRVRGGSCLGI